MAGRIDLADGRVWAFGALAAVTAIGLVHRGSAIRNVEVDWVLLDRAVTAWKVTYNRSGAYKQFASEMGIEPIAFGSTRVAFRLPSGHVLKLPWGKEGKRANVSERDAWKASGLDSEVRDFLVPVLAGDEDYVLMEYAKRAPWTSSKAFRVRYARWEKLVDQKRPGACSGDYGLKMNWGIHGGKYKLLDYECDE